MKDKIKKRKKKKKRAEKTSEEKKWGSFLVNWKVK